MRKLVFYKRLLIEIIETLIAICMVMSKDTKGYYRDMLEGHILALERFSSRLRVMVEKPKYTDVTLTNFKREQ